VWRKLPRPVSRSRQPGRQTVWPRPGLTLLVSFGVLIAAASCTDRGAAPVAQFTATPPSGPFPLTVFFDATASSDLDGAIVRYDWYYGDGTYGEGITTTHTFVRYGPHNVTLVVTDDDGLTGTATKWIGLIGPCGEYVPTPGTAKIVQVIDAPPEEYGCHDAVSIVFDFTPTDPSAPEKYLQPYWSDSGNHLTVGGGENPPRQWALDQGIAVGAEFPCVRKDETTPGPCTPVIFVFPTIDYSSWATYCLRVCRAAARRLHGSLNATCS